MVRLAYGVVAGRGCGVWASGPEGAALDASRAELNPGAPVVLGPPGADPAAALAGLRELVSAGGEILAGADVDLGGGFRSGRLAGAAGDRRDAVLAALRVLGTDGAARLGDRSAVLVALFGPAATKRVGTAATAALHDGRWTALHLASACSDLLGPEQLERILALSEPAETGRAQPYGLASGLALDLSRVLEPYPRPRRLTLLLDLWGVVAVQREQAARRRRVRALGGPREQTAEVWARHRRLVEDELVARICGTGRESASLLQIARWVPVEDDWREWLLRAMWDAVAGAVLLRAAIAVAEDGLHAGLSRVRPMFDQGLAPMTRRQQRMAQQRVRDLGPMPARPGVYVREINERLRADADIDGSTAAFVRSRLGLAWDYAFVAFEAARDLIESCAANGVDLSQGWNERRLSDWRAIAGYSALRPPGEWHQPVPVGPWDSPHRSERAAPLAQRLALRPDADPSDVETPADLLWLAELADVLAQVDGLGRAVIHYGESYPRFEVRARPPEPDPLRPADDSIVDAADGAAQLVELGAMAPPKPRTWPELVDGLMASTVVAEALTGGFAVPRVVLDRDGSRLAGPDLQVEVARDPHQLMQWAAYMGNCISGPFYLHEALRGRCVLMALREPGGRVVANVELLPHRTGWSVGEFRARFNYDPAPDLAERLGAWVATLPPAPRTRPVPTPRRAHPTGHRPFRHNRDLADLREALAPLAAGALRDPEVAGALAVLGHAAGLDLADGDGLAVVTALRRERSEAVDQTVRSALAGGLSLAALWRATAARPLATALDGLDPQLRRRSSALDSLLGDGPLVALPRRLARADGIAQARTAEVLARRLRRSLGRLGCADDPVLAPLVPREVDPGLLCALVLTVSTAAAPAAALTVITREVEVPGYPASTVDDQAGPWHRALPDAVELGALLPPIGAVAPLLIPTSWLPRGGWPALWARVHRTRSPAAR